MPHGSEPFDAILDAMLPQGGVAVVLHSYVDESGTDDSSPIMSVSGYLFRKKKAAQFNRRARSLLVRESLKHRLKRPRFFRMVDCAYGEGEFGGWDRPARIAIAKQMIELVRRHSEFGYSVLLNEDEYNARLAGRSGMPSAYAFACFAAIGMIRRFVTKHDYRGDIAYFFETGHEHEKNAGKFLNEIFASTRIARDHHYAGHAFQPKEKDAPLWAADMLSWHSYQNYIRETEGRPPRLDFMALARPDLDVFRFYNVEMMERLAEEFKQRGIPDDPQPFKPRRAAKSAAS